MPRALAIAGLGYCGQAIAKEHRDSGGEVIALDRFRKGVPEGVVAVQADLMGSTPSGVPAEWGVVTVGTQASGGDAAGSAAQWLARCGVRRAVYLSSTSVFGSGDGEWTDHTTLPAPSTEMGARRVEAEQSFVTTCARLGIEPVVLRMPGVYGPWRNFRKRLISGEYRYPSGLDRWTNRVHADDVATAVLTLLRLEQPERSYVVSDGVPFRSSELLEWACKELGIPIPAPVPWEQIPDRSKPFFSGNRQLNPSALFEVGWRPKHRNVFDGHASAWAIEDAEERSTKVGSWSSGVPLPRDA